MNKSSLAGLVVIGIILFGFSWYNSKQQEKLRDERAQRLETLNTKSESINREIDSLRDRIGVIRDSMAVSQGYEQQLSSSLGETLYSAMGGAGELFTVENEVMSVEFSTKGGMVNSVTLKDYKTYSGAPLRIFEEGSNRFDISIFTKSQQISSSEFNFTPVVKGDGAGNVVMRLYADSAAYMEYAYTLHPDSYMLDFKVNMVGMQDILASNQTDFLIDWRTTALQSEKGFTNENNYTTVAYMFPDDDGLEELNATSQSNSREEDARVKWVAFKQQFFSAVLIAGDAFQHGTFDYSAHAEGSGKLKDFHTQLSIPYSQNSGAYDFRFYFGPNRYSILKDYDLGMEKLVPLGKGLFRWINTIIIIPTFDLLSKYFANYGLIILLLTILLKLILFPLTYKSYLSMAKMRVLKPDVEAINAKYPDQKDAMKKQQATMELYRKAGANPMGGCLPLLLQLPLLIAMYRFFPASIELRQQSFLWADDLSSYDSILDLPFTIPLYGAHISLFTLLMAVSMFISSRMSYNQTASTGGPQMAGMKFMTLYLMPLMMVVWFNNYASALSYYWLLSNIITIGQNAIFRAAINEDKLHARMKANTTKPRKKSKFMERYEQALKQQQQIQQQQKRK